MAAQTIIIIQARMGSTRLPGKVLKEIQGKSLLAIQLERLESCRKASKIVIATTTHSQDEPIAHLASELGFEVFRGSENDVLSRYYHAALPHLPQWVVRITADCPLVDPKLVDEIITFTMENELDYGSNTLIEHFPDGQDIEVFSFAALEIAHRKARKSSEREHVTLFLKDHSTFRDGTLFRSASFPSENDYNSIRMTVDEAVDFELISRLINDLGTDKSWTEYTNYIIENNLMNINGGIIRNEGLVKSLEKDQL